MVKATHRRRLNMNLRRTLAALGLLGSSVGTACAAMTVCGTHEIRDGRIPGQTRVEIEKLCGAPEYVEGNNLYYRKGGVIYRLHFNDNAELESVQEEQQ